MERFFVKSLMFLFGLMASIGFLGVAEGDPTGWAFIVIFGGITFLFYKWSQSLLPEDVKQRKRELIEEKARVKHVEKMRNLGKTHKVHKYSVFSWNFVKTKILIGVGIWILTSVLALLFFDATPNASLQFGGVFSLLSVTINVMLGGNST